MQLTDETIAILKNFSSIQKNCVFPEGDTLKTISEARNIMACAKINQEFPRSFGIYELDKFLGVLSLVEDPTLDFSEEYVTVSSSSGRSKVKYFYSSPSVLTSPAKDINMPECEVSFTFDKTSLSRVLRASSALGHEKMTITPADGAICLTVVDNTDATSNAFSIEVPGSYDSDKFCFVMNIDNLKMVEGDYTVDVSSKLLSRFTNNNDDVVYYIAIEKSSTYGDQ